MFKGKIPEMTLSRIRDLCAVRQLLESAGGEVLHLFVVGSNATKRNAVVAYLQQMEFSPKFQISDIGTVT